MTAPASPRSPARVVGIEESPATVGGVAFPYAVTLALEVRGKTVERPVAARYEVADGEVTVEAVGTFRFTDFGIKPFSAFFGAVKDLDTFHVFLVLRGALPAQ